MLYCRDHAKDHEHDTAAPLKRAHGRGHRSAQPTVFDGIRFPSKLEARVYAALVIEARTDGARLYRQVRFPLWNLAPGRKLVPLAITIDFLLAYPNGRWRVVDAKPKKWKSRDWTRGKAAFEALYDTPIEERSE